MQLKTTKKHKKDVSLQFLIAPSGETKTGTAPPCMDDHSRSRQYCVYSTQIIRNHYAQMTSVDKSLLLACYLYQELKDTEKKTPKTGTKHSGILGLPLCLKPAA